VPSKDTPPLPYPSLPPYSFQRRRLASPTNGDLYSSQGLPTSALWCRHLADNMSKYRPYCDTTALTRRFIIPPVHHTAWYEQFSLDHL
jgi:hypothetical protein